MNSNDRLNGYLDFFERVAIGIVLGLILSFSYTGIVKLIAKVRQDKYLLYTAQEVASVMAVVALLVPIALPILAFTLGALCDIDASWLINWTVAWLIYVCWYGWLLGLVCHVVSWFIDIE